MRRSWLTAALFCTVCLAPLAAQQPRHGQLFPPENLGLLEGPDRAEWQKPEQIMDALAIADGSSVADIGAEIGRAHV